MPVVAGGLGGPEGLEGLDPGGPRRSRLTLPDPVRPVLLAVSRSRRVERTLGRLTPTRSVVERFVPGSSEEAVMDAVSTLLAQGRTVSVDYLGEDISRADEADRTVGAYLSLLKAYRRLTGSDSNGTRFEVSIKLSALGQGLPDGGELLALDHTRTICAAAEEAGALVTIDAEDHTTTESRLRIVREIRQTHPTVATVLQAYLHRTADDCRDLATPGSRIRLCKGAYNEPPEVAYRGRTAVDDAYRRCLEILMDGAGYPMVASHDPGMIDAAQKLAREAGRGSHDFEFQMLYGVRDDEQTRLVQSGSAVRTYVPFGDDWYGYFVRRLAERPANLLFLLRALRTRG